MHPLFGGFSGAGPETVLRVEEGVDAAHDEIGHALEVPIPTFFGFGSERAEGLGDGEGSQFLGADEAAEPVGDASMPRPG